MDTQHHGERPDRETFVVPTSAATARLRIEELVQQVEGIKARLQDPDRQSSKGKRLSTPQWRKWRSNTIRALTLKNEEISRLKAWLRAELARIDSFVIGAEAGTDEDLLVAAYRALSMMKETGLPPEVLIVHDQIKRRVHGLQGFDAERPAMAPASKPDKGPSVAKDSKGRRLHLKPDLSQR